MKENLFKAKCTLNTLEKSFLRQNLSYNPDSQVKVAISNDYWVTCMVLASSPWMKWLKGHSQLRGRADLDTSFFTLKRVHLNLKSKVRVEYI